MSSLVFTVGAATDVGQLREVNQDSFLATDGLAVVADGMGGHRGGEVASAIAVTSLRASFSESTLDSLTDGVARANGEIRAQAAHDPSLHGMGTTLCALAIIDHPDAEKLAIVNVGDSRAYVFVDGEMTQVTEDHSLVEALVREGRLTPEEAETHPQRNILTRALGVADSVEVDQFVIDPMPEARFLLCSDGLFNEVGHDEIARVLGETSDPNVAAQILVDAANRGGGRDNITAVIVDARRNGNGERVVSTAQSREAATDEVPVVDAHATNSGEPNWAEAGTGGPTDGGSGDSGSNESGSDRRRWWRFNS